MKLRNIAILAGATALAAGLAGCKTHHVDTRFHNAATSVRTTVANPRPVHYQFEFQINGSKNNLATASLQNTVHNTVAESGYFAELSPSPVPGGAELFVSIDNRFDGVGGAFLKGFVSGLTFKLIGYNMRDEYVCTVEYTPGDGASRITRTMRGGVWSGDGLIKFSPSDAEAMESADAAVKTMTQRTVSGALNTLAEDPNFNK